MGWWNRLKKHGTSAYSPLAWRSKTRFRALRAAPSYLTHTDLYHPSSTALNWDWCRSLNLSTPLLSQSSHRRRWTEVHITPTPFIAASSGFAHILTRVPTGCPTFSFLSPAMLTMRLPWWLLGKESARRCRWPGFHPGVGKIPWRRKWLPTPVLFPGKSHRQRSW